MGPIPLADEYFLIGQDEYSGKPAVNVDVIGIGIAGAVLGELILEGRLTIAEKRVVVRDPRPYGDSVTDSVLNEVRTKGNGHSVRAWVEYLRTDIRESVGRRLSAAGVVRRERSRLRSTVRFPGVDPLVAARPRVRVSYVLSRDEPLDAQTATLAALIGATGLDHVLTAGLSRTELRERLAYLTENLPAVLNDLVSGVDAATAAVALTIRR